MKNNDVLFCSHCGNAGILSFITYIDTPYQHGSFGNMILDASINYKRWLLFQCPVCKNPTIISEYISANGQPIICPEIAYEFPTTNVHFDGVPENISTAFDSAIKTKGIDRAICILSLRRTLEMICKEKGALGKDLKEKIADLISKKILPEMMTDACWIVRQSGNDAAHADDTVFTEREVDEIIEYVSTVINYLYSMPVRIARLKHQIEERKQNLKK
jgi:hypothetical protein